MLVLFLISNAGRYLWQDNRSKYCFLAVLHSFRSSVLKCSRLNFLLLLIHAESQTQLIFNMQKMLHKTSVMSKKKTGRSLIRNSLSDCTVFICLCKSAVGDVSPGFVMGTEWVILYSSILFTK